MKHFLSRNIEDQMNAFDGKKIHFSVKICTHYNLRNVLSTNPSIQMKEKVWGKEYVKRYLKQIINITA